jgi:branched-chain amino acid transport system permease protein
VFGSIFMVVIMELLQIVVIPLAAYFPKLLVDFAYIKDAAFGLAIAGFVIYEPNGIAYRWWQIKNYFNLWPFSY